MFGFALDGDALQRLQRIGAALGRNGRLDEINRGFLGRCELDRRGARKQHGSNAKQVLHVGSPMVFIASDTRGDDYIGFEPTV
jgi:hypothetical protein